jgi:exo-beta-1,3-glucanase (GH17 family)
MGSCAAPLFDFRATSMALKWLMRLLLLLGTLAALAPLQAGAAVSPCPPNGAAAPALERLRTSMAAGRFVAYEPTSLAVANGKVTAADPVSVRADLTVLRHQFDGLITYDAIHGAESIAPLAAELHFRALIIGVWDPTDATQLAAALTSARRYPTLVVGISLGNELLFAQRSDPTALSALVRRVRVEAPALALTTTEPFHIYQQPNVAALLKELDFLLVNVHPVFQPWFRSAGDATAAQFVVNVLTLLRPLACGPLLVKETGVPTAPVEQGFSETRQAAFYRELRGRLTPTRDQAFSYFAAFDAPWRALDATPVAGPHAEEAHWGLFDSRRVPKEAARELAPLPH